jgi:hypothetical protein
MAETTLWSLRFNKAIQLTHHAKARMQERDMTETLLLDLIEHGEMQFKDGEHGWLFKTYPDRNDNLVCAAIVMNNAIIVKTVMINWQLEE